MPDLGNEGRDARWRNDLILAHGGIQHGHKNARDLAGFAGSMLLVCIYQPNCGNVTSIGAAGDWLPAVSVTRPTGTIAVMWLPGTSAGANI